MRFQLEIREPFLDQSIVRYASELDKLALLGRTGDAPVGKMPLRALYDLYPSELPTHIRDRQKVAFDKGAGADMEGLGWHDLFEATVSNADLRDGQREFSAFKIATKEELIYFRILAAKMDVKRVPHLRGRLQLDMRPRSRKSHSYFGSSKSLKRRSLKPGRFRQDDAPLRLMS
jgi:asparagine synthase (glutamine-hydrolysing)